MKKLIISIVLSLFSISLISNAEIDEIVDKGEFKLKVKDYCLSTCKMYPDFLNSSVINEEESKIGIFEFQNDTRVYNAQKTLYSYVVSNAVRYKPTKLKVIDRYNLKRLLREQKLGMSGIVDGSSAAEAGKLLGLNYVVIGRLLNVVREGGHVSSERVQAYKLYPKQTSNGSTIFRGRPTTFNLHEGNLKIVFEAKYQVISVETGEIIADEIVTASEDDYVKYATYNGDYTKLCAINPNHTVVMQMLASKSMIDQSLFTARKRFKTSNEIQRPIMKDLAQKIAYGICRNFK